MKKIDKYPVIIAFVIWCIINISGITKLYFSGGNILLVAIIKIAHLIFLWFMAWTLKKIFVSRKNQVVK